MRIETVNALISNVFLSDTTHGGPADQLVTVAAFIGAGFSAELLSVHCPGVSRVH